MTIEQRMSMLSKDELELILSKLLSMYKNKSVPSNVTKYLIERAYEKALGLKDNYTDNYLDGLTINKGVA